MFQVQDSAHDKKTGGFEITFGEQQWKKVPKTTEFKGKRKRLCNKKPQMVEHLEIFGQENTTEFYLPCFGQQPNQAIHSHKHGENNISGISKHLNIVKAHKKYTPYSVKLRRKYGRLENIEVDLQAEWNGNISDFQSFSIDNRNLMKNRVTQKNNKQAHKKQSNGVQSRMIQYPLYSLKQNWMNSSISDSKKYISSRRKAISDRMAHKGIPSGHEKGSHAKESTRLDNLLSRVNRALSSQRRQI